MIKKEIYKANETIPNNRDMNTVLYKGGIQIGFDVLGNTLVHKIKDGRSIITCYRYSFTEERDLIREFEATARKNRKLQEELVEFAEKANEYKESFEAFQEVYKRSVRVEEELTKIVNEVDEKLLKQGNNLAETIKHHHMEALKEFVGIDKSLEKFKHNNRTITNRLKQEVQQDIKKVQNLFVDISKTDRKIAQSLQEFPKEIERQKTVLSLLAHQQSQTIKQQFQKEESRIVNRLKNIISKAKREIEEEIKEMNKPKREITLIDQTTGQEFKIFFSGGVLETK